MPRRILASLVSLLLVGSAYADPTTPSYAVISLVGDKIDIVTYRPQVGSQLDSNAHVPLTLSADEFDTVALRTVNRVLKADAPGAPVALLAASTADAFEDQGRMFSGSHVTLPAEIDAAIHREGATTLVLITKHRSEARLQVADGYIGSGKIEGLGFYLNINKRMKVRETGVRSVGFLAPFVYVDVWLIDVATGTVTRSAAITSGHTIGASNNPEGVSPWDALSTQEKVATLKSMLAEELAAVVPALVSGNQAPTSAASSLNQ